MPIVMVGGSESYEARCRRCFRIPRQNEDQVALL
jgi:thymidine kinase